MAKLRDLITEREFGEPLPTFKDVMEKHQINKLKEDWWSDMDAAAQAQYIKDHPGSRQAQNAADDEADDMDRDARFAADAEDEPSHPDDMDDRDVFQFLNKDEPEGKKDAKGITRYTRKDAQGREYDPMTGKGKGQDYRGEPDDEEWYKSMMSRTGKELNQETITVDGKQFRRINESVENKQKPKYEFSEFYERFKK